MRPTLLPSTTPELLGWLLQSTFCLSACWLLYRYVLRQERFFHYNRRFLQFAPWLALLLPRLVSVGLAIWPAAPAPAATGLVLSGGLLSGPTVQAVGSALYNLPHWLPLLYYAGVLGLLLRLVGQVLHVRLSARHFRREPRNGYTLLYTGGQRPTSSFGRRIFWDETVPLTPAEARAVLAHELAHVEQGHTAEKLRLELVRALLWPNPFVHLFPGALAQVQEFMADAQALRLPSSSATASPAAYAGLLARLALRPYQPDLPLTQSFTQSLTLTRIRMLTSSSAARRWKQWLLLPLGMALLAGVAACEKAAELPPPPPPVVADARLASPSPPPAVYTSVEQMPQYEGGNEQLITDIGKQVVYPQAAKDARLGGKVFIRFVVAADGTVQAAEVAKGVETTQQFSEYKVRQRSTTLITTAAESLNDAALAAVRSLPGRWIPGRQNSKAVAVSYVVPVTFALN